MLLATVKRPLSGGYLPEEWVKPSGKAGALLQILEAVKFQAPANRSFVEYGKLYLKTSDDGVEMADSKSQQSYILATPLSLEKKTYQDGSVELQLEEVEEKWRPYLEDSKYCQIDDDCLIRTEYCHTGAFNHFKPYVGVMGCGGGYYEGLEHYGNMSESVYNGDICADYKVEYSEAVCIENKCRALNPVIKCGAEK